MIGSSDDTSNVGDLSCNMITSALVESYSQCTRKAFLFIQGHVKGVEHELSVILKERAQENRLRFALSQKTDQKPDGIQDYAAPFTIKDNDLIADHDFLSRPEPNKSSSRKTHDQHEPCLTVGTYSPSKEQRLRLAFAGHVINAATKHRPLNGFIVTLDGQKHRINLRPHYSKISSIVDALRAMINAAAATPPKLFLNSHCPLCPFRNHCRQEAEENDNLSLLGNMTPKIIRKHEKRGIFTIKQLSYIYNPRRRRKKSFATNNVFNFSLQALALRAGKTYLHKTPSIVSNPVEIFLDIEGIPDQDFYYLIGLIVINQGNIENHSFWADTRDDEEKMFKNFIAVTATYANAPIYHYGSCTKPLRGSRIASACCALGSSDF
jgi:predicted RecB family nuclease